jgi:putative ABC transport system permease protein
MERSLRTILKSLWLSLQKTPLAWLQLTYQKSRFVAASLGIAASITLMFLQFGFLGALFLSSTTLHRHLQGDLIMLNAKAESLLVTPTFSRRYLYQALGFDEITAVSPVYYNSAIFKNLASARARGVAVYGINTAQPPFDFPEVNQQLEVINLWNTVLFDSRSRPEFGPIAENFHAGQEIQAELNGQAIRIGGVAEFTGPSFGVTGNLITSDFNFHRLIPGRNYNAENIDFGLLWLRPGTNPKVFAAQLRQVFLQDVKVLTLEEFIALEKIYWNKTTAVGAIFSMGALVGFGVGMYIVYQILHSEISNAIPDYAILKARGYRNRYFLLALGQNSIFLSLSSYIISYGVSIWLYRILVNTTKLPIAMTGERAISVYGLTLLMCLASAGLVAHKLNDSDPADLF